MDDSKKQVLNTTLKQLEKQFGKGTVMCLGEMAVTEVETISTGSLALDIALGVGGLPKGRVVEIYGPEASGKTTLTLQIAAEVQKKGGLVAFVDAEHALDSQYAEKIGVNVNELYLAQPSNGEEALEITDTLVRSGAFELVVIDSVAALTPKAEIEGEMGDSHMGLHARLMSQALRKLTANISRTHTLVIFINQIRMKIGVMFGCFDYDSQVVLADGSQEKIGKLVETKKPVKVRSYNTITQRFEPRRIINWFDNGETNQFLAFKVASNQGYHQFACTANHQLLTVDGYRAAGDLTSDDKLMTSSAFQISPYREQILWGSLLAKSSRSPDGKSYKKMVREYYLWKQSFLSSICQPALEMEHSRLDINALESQSSYQSFCQAITYPLIERLEPLAIAIWYLEAGVFDTSHSRCLIDCCGMSFEKQEALKNWFHQHQITPLLKPGFGLVFDQHETIKLHQMIAPYVHPAMAHKIHPKQHNQFVPLNFKTQSVLRAVPMPIIDIQTQLATATNNHRFDLEIESNHNYVVDGVVVHNSPETTTGGNALKFYSSVRLEIRRIGGVKRGEEIIGNETRVKVAKNKVAPPFREVTFDIIYGEGISRESELLELGTKYDIIDKSGAWYSYQGNNIAQGKDNARQYLKDNPTIAQTIEQQIRDKLLSPNKAATSQSDNSSPTKATGAQANGTEKEEKEKEKGRRGSKSSDT
jgi:recombination protein RecA